MKEGDLNAISSPNIDALVSVNIKISKSKLKQSSDNIYFYLCRLSNLEFGLT